MLHTLNTRLFSAQSGLRAATSLPNEIRFDTEDTDDEWIRQEIDS